MAAAAIGEHGARGEVSVNKDASTGWDVFTITQGNTTAKLVPSAGCNVYSIAVNGVEFFHAPQNLKDLPGFAYGNPVLYPTPNRVKNAVMHYGGKEYRFPANNGPNFLHGLVHSVEWRPIAQGSDSNVSFVECQFDFAPGSQAYELFPFPHSVRLKVEVKPGAVRFAYTVDNTKGKEGVPFGMCYHPYFLYLGERKNTFLKAPAGSHMEAVDLLPTGRLESLDGSKYDARKPVSLEGFVVDDVYAGMKSNAPAEVEFRDAMKKIALLASDDFTHLVVYTPEGRPFFCVENQTCSTDAHNLHVQGKGDVAHLQICEPGKTSSGWAEFQFSELK